MKKSRDAILVSSLATAAVLGACSHTQTRSPASDPQDLNKYSVNFTLIRDPDIDKIVRVFRGSPNGQTAGVERVEISNPGGQVACQNGTPPQPDAPPPQNTPYSLETHSDQDINCYLGPDAPTVVSIQVDYYYPKVKVAGDGQSASVDALLKAQHEVEAQQYSRETLGLLQQHNLHHNFYLFVRPETGSLVSNRKAGIIAPGYSQDLVVGDLLTIQSASGKIQTDGEKVAYEVSGEAVASSRFGKSPSSGISGQNPGKTADHSGDKADEDYRFPNERPNRLICTLEDEGAAPRIIFRGGDAPLSTREAHGHFHCQINVKTSAHAHVRGNFKVEASVLKRETALAELKVFTHSDGQADLAREQAANEERLGRIRDESTELIQVDAGLVERYNQLIVERRQGTKSERITRATQRRATGPFFPDSVLLNFRPGPHTFQVIPVMHPLPTSEGIVNYVDYTIQNGSTPYFPQDPQHVPSVLAHENLVAPPAPLMSAERWEQVNQAPWAVVVCPEKISQLTATLKRISDDNRRNIMSTRESLWKMFSGFGAANASDCDPSWFDLHIRGVHPVYEPMYFQRQEQYLFAYVRANVVFKDGRDLKNTVVYNPDRIEALYVSPAGAGLARVYTRDQDGARGPGNGHSFFIRGKATRVQGEKSDELPPEIQFETRTLFPPVSSDGILEGFPSR